MARTLTQVRRMFAALAAVANQTEGGDVEREIWSQCAIATRNVRNMAHLWTVLYDVWETYPADTEKSLVLEVAVKIAENSI